MQVLYKQTVQQFDMYLPLLSALNSLHNKRTIVVQDNHSRQSRRAAQRTGQQSPDQRTITVKDYVEIMVGALAPRPRGQR
jgi:hypothetical protein